MRRPSSRISPDSARIVSSIRLNRVVLPDPFGPIRPVIEPSGTVKEAPSTAFTPPKWRLRSRTSSRARSGISLRSTSCTRSVIEARLPPVPIRAPTRPALPLVRRQLSTDSIAGMMPLGRKITTAISSPPNRNSRVLPPPQSLLAISLSHSTRNAPITGPHRVALPPISIERISWTLIRMLNMPRGSMKVR